MSPSRAARVRRPVLFWTGVVLLLAGVSALILGRLGLWRAEALLEVVHLPRVYGRRTPGLSANVVGRIHQRAWPLRFRVNDGPWRLALRGSPRTPAPLFTAEMPLADLLPGRNWVRLEASAPFHPGTALALAFDYDPAPPRPSFLVEWREADLEAQDGWWETIPARGAVWVRPRPGQEGYDRILQAAAAFPVPRAIEVEMVFRRDLGRREFGFGVLTLWGGHPDDWTRLPRRGWSFALAWYWSKPGGAGGEISHKQGADAPAWVNTYRSLECPPDGRHRLKAEIVPEFDAQGRHLRHRQRLKWWLLPGPEPAEWLELGDDAGAPLPPGDYGIALLAYNCQVEFGPLRVEAPPRPASTP